MKTLQHFILVTALLAAGCKKDHADQKTIIGTWQETHVTNSENNVVEKYNFNTDGSFNISSVVVSKADNQVLGYTGKSNGTFTQAGNDITLNYKATYVKSDNSKNYVPADQLTLVTSVSFPTLVYTTGFNAKGDSLSLNIHCPPNADCIGIQWFGRQ